jgi:malate synthase
MRVTVIPRVAQSHLRIDERLYDFVRDEVAPGTGITPDLFWTGAARIFAQFTPAIRRVLDERSRLQQAIDDHHRRSPFDRASGPEYERFLRLLGYLTDEPADFRITTENVDHEIAMVAGPQLVVPVTNARFAVNAANARWGSLYDALYGTDMIGESPGMERGGSYNVVRGQEVISRARAFLDEHFPLGEGRTHASATAYAIDDEGLTITLGDHATRLKEPSQLVGYAGSPGEPSAVLLVHHGLHVEIQIDRGHAIGGQDAAGVKDVVLESAVTTIVDLEDSVSAVDVDDKVHAYRNWLNLMQGRLEEKVTKNGETFVRRLSPDREYHSRSGQEAVVLPGRALLLVRHVGHHMFTDAVLDENGESVPEGVLDALITAFASIHDLHGRGPRRNSRSGSMYVVKPKMHGPEEVALACEVFAAVEQAVGLAPLTIKIGIMDEERRTSANLKACIKAASDRVVFINTGFLDRTGDEIHTSMFAGPMVRKADMKSQTWLRAYEDANVDVGLACGFRGRAQVGKGMWAAPDSMADMVREKLAHPLAGASCAWVPSPTAATLHALHYHRVDVFARQLELEGSRRASLSDLLVVPLGGPWTDAERLSELDNNVQSTLGYVVRWVNAGVGCSKVPDINGTSLMEDRATCRISSQHVANWLLHRVLTLDEVEDSLRRMAVKVDAQNADDPSYVPMAPDFDGEAFKAARDLLLEGRLQPAGYTEPILHRHRLTVKAAGSGHLS